MSTPYSAQRKARILVVDDHPIVRQGISQLIDREADLQACGEAATAEEALAACQSAQPDLAIVDLSLTGISGLKLIKQLRSRFPTLAILIMSMHDETVYAERCLQAGANGYLMKQEATATVLSAVRGVLRGELHLSARMRSLLLEQRISGQGATSPVAGLTAAEFEVLGHIAKGLGIGEIARRLNRSASTIETHRANIKRKLDVATNSELVLYAYNRLHQVDPEPAPS